jgi:cytoskeleton protein RodZ
MGTFGDRLRRERETRGITLEQVSESTKISSRSLQALERDEFDKLPGGIFNKGFVRAYAHHLGLDEDQAVSDFITACGGEKEQPLPDPPIQRAIARGQRTEAHANWRGFVSLICVLAIGVAMVWKVGPLTFREISGFVSSRLKVHPADEPSASPAVVAQPVAENTASSVTAPQKKSTTKAQAVTVAASAAVVAPSPSSNVDTPATSDTSSSSFVVQVVAKENAWVQIVADGKLLSEGVLVPPTEKQVRAAEEVVIKTKTAAGVEVSLNGHLLPSLGGQYETATVTLNAGGVQR